MSCLVFSMHFYSSPTRAKKDGPTLWAFWDDDVDIVAGIY